MGDSLVYKLRSGKPPKFIYFAYDMLKMAIPSYFYRMQLKRTIAQLSKRPDRAYIEERVSYYNRLSGNNHPIPQGTHVENKIRYLIYRGKLGNYKMSYFHKAYFFDAREYTRWFSPDLRWQYCPGDVYFTPDSPSVALSDITDEMKSQIKVATIGDSSSLQLGQEVVAIGNALGYGQSVTTGIISALNREVSVANDDGTSITNKLIQTDAAINPGNSGGALLNMNGELIGINSVKVASSSVEGMGYAIPISDASDTIQNLMNQETKTKVSEAERGYLGITGLDVEDSDSQRYGMPTGVYISEVSRGGGAADAGITKGSIIVGFNGITIDSMESLQEQLQYYKKGEKVTLTLQVPGDGGEYQEQTVDVTLGSKAQ